MASNNSLAALTVYNHYLTAYAPKGTTAADTHKKSELRSVYNSIVKLNKESPLYLLNNSQDSRAYAIGLKESARELQNTITLLGGQDEADVLNMKEAFSTNEEIAEAKYIGTPDQAKNAPQLAIEVKALAGPQVNMGRAVPASEPIGLPGDTYSFDLTVNDLSYEFQFKIADGDTNVDVQNRLKRLIDHADVGIKAEVTEENGMSTLQMVSAKNGSTARGYQFMISDDQTSKSSGVVAYFAMDHVERAASDAEFVLNGMERSTTSNNFTIEKMYEITLNGVSPEEGVTANIGIKADTENLMANLKKLAGGYNEFLGSAIAYAEKYPKSNQLVREMWSIAGDYAQPLSEVGLNIAEDGTLDIDENALQQSVNDGSIGVGIEKFKDFTKALSRKAGQVALNPMDYVDKKVVEYKNPGKNFASPYVTSNYSGMLFNNYC
ncbi:MAG: hypothetical protein K6G07_08940 [Lachnospiraceae bacterium]|nr:hypothetical protein [Lachnospiraceae bacterium]